MTYLFIIACVFAGCIGISLVNIFMLKKYKEWWMLVVFILLLVLHILGMFTV